MKVPEIFEFGSILSIPLFSIIALFLIKETKDFSFSKSTVSRSVLFFDRPIHAFIFRLNFVIKSLLDVCFIFYVSDRLKLSFNSPPFLLLISSALFFGSLAYFTEGKYTVLHRILVYGSGVLWAAGQIYLSRIIGDMFFIQLTNIMVIIPIILVFGFMFAKKTNVFIQALCMFIWYIWLIIFVFEFL